MPSLADLIRMGKQYVSDALPGGSLNSEVNRQGILDGAALSTTAVPVLGDLLGLGADLNRYATDPESRTAGNFALSGLGLLPFVPAMTAWHGSPHKFDKFSLDKIGTGEGAQAYGHGAYLGEARAVGEEYMRKLAGKENTGYLYKTDIPDEAVARFLDWDKPLSQDSPQAFKDAFNKLHETYPALKEQFFQAFRDKRPGNHYYSLLNDYAKTGDLVKNQTFATNAMRDAGIPGIRYLDGGSRSAGQGSSNFVAFDPEMIRILERNGQPTGLEPWKPGEYSLKDLIPK